MLTTLPPVPTRKAEAPLPLLTHLEPCRFAFWRTGVADPQYEWKVKGKVLEGLPGGGGVAAMRGADLLEGGIAAG